MKRRIEDIKKIEEILIANHRTKKSFSVTQEWQTEVMRHIRQITAVKTQTNDDRAFGKIIWRFATATSLCAVILLLYAINTDVNYESIIENLVLNDPISFTVSQIISP